MEMLLRRGKLKEILVKLVGKTKFSICWEKRKLINKTDALQRPTDQPANKGTPEQIEAE